ncbi:MAG TPA: PEP/pyruvate-binding domain-containing protein [Solirubrobacterales bacterium]|nr:PEP/pyruvate-binding domain-containing protein [Solirubrobacterales bacterium]
MIAATDAHSGVLLGDALLANCDEREIGGKARGLLQLAGSGAVVPPFLVVSAAAFRAHLLRAEIPAALGEAMLALSEVEVGDPAALGAFERIAASLRAAVEAAPLDEAIAGELAASLAQLGAGPYAVRSSMVGEDSARHSFAGQLDSELYQREDDVLGSVRRCWASSFGARALAYAARLGLPPTAVRTAVIVQQMVDAEASGVAFTANPLTGSRDECMVTATYGLGEGVVSGVANADEYLWPAAGDEQATIANKDVQVIRAESGIGTTEAAVPKTMRDERALSPAQVAEVVKTARAIAAGSGKPMDVEFSYAEGQLHVLQARPITSLPLPAAEGPVRVYDNSNIQESYNGVTTPLTFSFASRAYSTVFRQFARTLGASRGSLADFEPAARTLIGLVRGRVFYNLGSWLELLALLPGGEQKRKDLEVVMWRTTIEGAAAERRSPARRALRAVELVGVGGRLLFRFARMEREIEQFLDHFHSVYDAVDRRALREASLPQLFEVGQVLQSELLDRWEIPNINDFRVLMTSGHLRRLLERHYPPEEVDGHLADLLGGIEGIESVEPTRLLLELARDAREEPAAVAAIRGGEGDAAIADLHRDAPEIAARLDAFIERYGDRTMGELKLETVTYRDDPSFLISVLASYFDVPDLDPEGLAAAERERFEAKLADLSGRLPVWRRPLLSWELGVARRAVKGREATRLRRTLAFGLARDIYRAAGLRLAEAGFLDDENDVVYLTVDELDAFVEGRAVSVDLAPIAAARKAEFERYAEIEVANRFRTTGSPYVGNDLTEMPAEEAERPPAADGALRGLGCCAGVVKGPVRVIFDPRGEPIENGDILCTVRTDPGWAALFPTISGLIVERGSALSHSAVVAREFGIPTVVGVPEVTKLLQNGETVRLDGTAGTVERTA